MWVNGGKPGVEVVIPTGHTCYGNNRYGHINLPPNFVEGSVTIIADGVWTWTAAGNISAAGTVTTAGTSVVFNYDAATGKWSPSRVA